MHDRSRRHPPQDRGIGGMTILVIVFIALLVAGWFYLDKPNPAPYDLIDDPYAEGRFNTNESVALPDEDRMPLELHGPIIAGKVTPLYEFTQADYETTLSSDKLIVLYFYANWCSICREETESALYPAFSGMHDPNVIGFRANFNDDDTDETERALARKFGVVNQNTKVFVKNGERVLKSLEVWDRYRYLSEIDKLK